MCNKTKEKVLDDGGVGLMNLKINESIYFLRDVCKKCNLSVKLVTTGKLSTTDAEKIHKSYSQIIATKLMDMSYIINLSLALKAMLSEAEQALAKLEACVLRTSY